MTITSIYIAHERSCLKKSIFDPVTFRKGALNLLENESFWINMNSMVVRPKSYKGSTKKTKNG